VRRRIGGGIGISIRAVFMMSAPPLPGGRAQPPMRRLWRTSLLLHRAKDHAPAALVDQLIVGPEITMSTAGGLLRGRLLATPIHSIAGNRRLDRLAAPRAVRARAAGQVECRLRAKSSPKLAF